LRLDPNLTNHHHVICTRCRTVIDLAEDDVEPVRFKRKLPAGFRMERYEVDVLGLCAKCVESTSGKGP
jgi:Fur family peroxide stress response transcriptional regulator